MPNAQISAISLSIISSEQPLEPFSLESHNIFIFLFA